jgi:Co/Zn/Cd efflux system component
MLAEVIFGTALGSPGFIAEAGHRGTDLAVPSMT